MSANFDHVCRLCLTSQVELLPIFPTTSTEASGLPVLASKIQACVDVQIKTDDALPTSVCRKCLDNVNNWYIFKKICKRAQTKLQSLCSNDENQLDQGVKVKCEPGGDETYDDNVLIDISYPDFEQNAIAEKVQPEGPPILASLGLTPKSDKNVDPRQDWHRVDAILNIIQEDEVIDALKSAEEMDAIYYSEHESDEDMELCSDIEEEYVDTKVSKTGFLKRDNDLLSKLPLLCDTEIEIKLQKARKFKRKIPPKSYSNPKAAWSEFFTQEMLEFIVDSTNNEIVLNGSSEDCTNLKEIKALIGVLYIHGISRPVLRNRKELWHEDYGCKIVNETLTQDRFEFLLRNLRFDVNREADDPMASIRQTFELFSKNCREKYDIGEIGVLDEKIEFTFGPCPIRFNIPRKHFKSGIKIVMLVDPMTFYVSNLDVITSATDLRPIDVVDKLVHHLRGTKKTLIMDSWFASSELISYLKEYDIYGIWGAKREDVPPIFLWKGSANISRTAYVDQDVKLFSYVTKDEKVVNVLTNHPEYYKKSIKVKSSPVFVYKQHKSACDIVNVLTNYYTSAQNTNSWTLSLFFSMLNIASINSQVLFLSANKDIVERRLFIRELAIELISESFNAIRSEESQRPKRSKPYLPQGSALVMVPKRRRCALCKEHKRCRKTQTACLFCAIPICREHQCVMCTICQYNVAKK